MNLSPGMISQIPIWTDASGEVRFSRLFSYLWMVHNGIYQKAKQEGYKDSSGRCKYCAKSEPQLLSTNAGWARCICQLLQEEEYLKAAQELASSNTKQGLDSFQVWGDTQSKDALVKAKDAIEAWMILPSKWLVIAGGFGTGKTHLMNIVNTHFSPWSLYVSVPDFEQLVFKYTENHDLDEILDVISSHPVLLLDDVGADYGSKYPVSMLRRVIDFRYRKWWEFPTMITTNLSPAQLETYDGRTADRMLDRKISQIISMSSVKSWRRHGN